MMMNNCFLWSLFDPFWVRSCVTCTGLMLRCLRKFVFWWLKPLTFSLTKMLQFFLPCWGSREGFLDSQFHSNFQEFLCIIFAGAFLMNESSTLMPFQRFRHRFCSHISKCSSARMPAHLSPSLSRYFSLPQHNSCFIVFNYSFAWFEEKRGLFTWRQHHLGVSMVKICCFLRFKTQTIKMLQFSHFNNFKSIRRAEENCEWN